MGGVLTGGGEELVHSVSGPNTLACNEADNWAGLTRAGDMYPAPVDGLAQERGDLHLNLRYTMNTFKTKFGQHII